jgi:hypothetical protein
MKSYTVHRYIITGELAMPKETVFTIKLESHIVREYDEFLARKVEAARVSMRASQGISNDDVEAEFAARRASVMGQK